MGKIKFVNFFLYKCDLCEFVIKNIYIFKRYRVRCKKERKKIKGKAKTIIFMFVLVAIVKGIIILRIRFKDFDGQFFFKLDRKGSVNFSLVVLGKVKNRSYFCIDCGFSIGKFKVFLFY